MNPLPLRQRIVRLGLGRVLAGLWLVLCAGPVVAQAPRPLGAWFAGYEKLTFDDEIAWDSGAFVVSHYASSFYTPFRARDLGNYSAVLIGSRAGRSLEPREQGALERWVSGGGHFVIAGAEGQRLFGAKPPAWLGVAEWRDGGAPLTCSVQRPGHPLARDLDRVAGPKAQWQTSTTALPGPKAVSIIGEGKWSLLLVAEHGKGKIIYLGGTLTPQGRPVWHEKEVVRDLTPLARQVWHNLLAFLNVPRRADVIRRWATAEAKGRDATLAFWWRYQKETPLGARLLAPPHPLPSDELKELKFDVGIGERCRRPLFVTALKEQEVTVAATDLTSEAGRIPGSRLRLFVQERPVPAYPKAAYWLVPVRGPLSLRADDATTFWLVLDPCQVKPGIYRGALEFRGTGKGRPLAGTLPICLKVWNIRYPGPEALHFELEHCWFTMPGGYWIEKDRTRKAAISLEGRPLVRTALNDPAVLGHYIKALGELEVDFAQSWSDVSKLYPLSFLRLREDGTLLADALRTRPERFRKELPRLDFSAVFDDFFDPAVVAGMRYYAMNYSRADDGTLGLARQVTGDAKLPAESETHRRVRTWYWSEYVRYVRERGLLGVYTKIYDEFSAKEVPDFVASAQAIRPAGIRTYTTTYNFDRNAKAIKEIGEHIDLWQTGWELSPRRRLASAGAPLEGREVWGTTASSFWGNNLDYGRAAGWVAAAGRYGGIHTHGYMRWFWNDHEGCFVGPDGPFNSVSVINNAQGITEGRYVAQLLRLIDAARRMPKTARLADEVEKELRTRVVGTASSCLVRLHDQPGIPGGGFSEYWWPDVCLSPTVYEAAKFRVFALIERLQKAGLAPGTLGYGDFVLVRDGKATAVVVGDAAAPLVETARSLTGVSLPRRSSWGEVPAVIVGTRDQPPLKGLIEKELKAEVTPHYPQPGHYLIRMLPGNQSHPRLLLVIGGDRAGVGKGVSNLVKLLALIPARS